MGKISPLYRASLHFVDEKAKVNADYYVNQLLPKSLDDCHQLLGQRFVSNTQQVTQQWLAARCVDFIDKDSWPPNSPDINPLDYHVWGSVLQKFCHPKSRPN